MLLNLKMQILLQMKLIQTQLNQLNNNSQQNQIRQINQKSTINKHNHNQRIMTTIKVTHLKPQHKLEQTLTKKEATTSEVTNRLNTQNSDNNISIDGQTNPTLDSDKSSKQNKDAQSGLNTLKNNAVATTNTQSKSQATGTKDQTNKVAKQAQYKNQDPIILVHGFNGFTDDINPSVLAHYWGGDKLNIRQDLEENGYESYEASISAFGSNYDRAVELYYYIKGGTVDYGRTRQIWS